MSSNLKSYNSSIKDYDAKSSTVKAKNTKYNQKIIKAKSKESGYKLKYDKAIAKGKTEKAGKYEKKRLKAESKLTYNKWAVKSEKTTALAMKTQAKLEKNQRVIDTYNRTLKALDKGKIEQGRLFMQYVLED